MKATCTRSLMQAFVEATAAGFGERAQPGSPVTGLAGETRHPITVVCELVGGIRFYAIFGMSTATADRICSRVLGHSVVSFDRLAAQAMSDFFDECMHRAAGKIEASFEIKEATIIRGAGVPYWKAKLPALVFPFDVGQVGEVDLYVCAQEPQSVAA
jgi:CheY-specific phosphatase CheX